MNAKAVIEGLPVSFEIEENLEPVDEQEWQALAGGNPFIGYRFLKLLQDTGCAAPEVGWTPKYLLLKRGKQLVGAAPCYLKTHSRGEFVFDQAWAAAYEQHGLHYYPKLIVASPFTPVSGPRLLAQDAQVREILAQAVQSFCKLSQVSSAHVLFVEDLDREVLQAAGFMLRESVQFHWHNQNYKTPEDFLGSLSQDKRKKIRQDSKYVAAAGIAFKWLEGEQLSDSHIDFFYSCYVKTYESHWSAPYLSREFFQRAHRERILDMTLILAMRGTTPVACALNVKGPNALYGRYWGTTELVKGLHFETCYMQAISYCIDRQIGTFEGGAQGEHKMARGLLPVKTFSAHHVVHRQFSEAISNFLLREERAVDRYLGELESASPYKLP